MNSQELTDTNADAARLEPATSEDDLTPELLKNPDIRLLKDITRNLCDSGEFPHVLFCTIYGNMPKTTQDEHSDLDLRVVHTGTLTLVERARFLTAVQTAYETAAPKPKEIELYFSDVASFLKGSIGQEGVRPVTAKLNQADSSREEVFLQDPSVFSLYVFGTQRYLSHSVEEVAAKLRDLGISESPKKIDILNAITLTPLGAYEWMHQYLAQFLSYRRELSQKQPGLYTSEYAFLVAKIGVRIALGVLIAQLDAAGRNELKQELVKNLINMSETPDATPERVFTHAINHLCETNEAASLPMMLRQQLMIAAEYRSERELVLMHANEDTVLPEFCKTMELLIFRLAQVGSSERRMGGEAEKTDIFDQHVLGSGVEFMLLEALGSVDAEMLEAGSTIISTGAESDGTMWFIPAYAVFSDSDSQNKTLQANDGEIVITYVEGGNTRTVTRSGGRVVGELGALFAIPRTANVVVGTKQVFAYKLSGERLLELSRSAKIQELIRNPYLSSDPKVHLEALTTEYVLRMLCLELTTTLTHRSPKEAVSEEKPAVMSTDGNPFANWFIEEFEVVLEKALQAAQEKPTIRNFEEAGTLFSAGDVSTGTMYIVVSEAMDNTPTIVLSNFADNDSAKVNVYKGGIIGDSALVGEEKRSCTAVVAAGTRLIEIKAEAFERITTRLGLIQGTTHSFAELFLHLLAVTAYRVKRNVV